MKKGFLYLLLLVALAALILASLSLKLEGKRNPAAEYAKEKDLEDELVEILKPLGEDGSLDPKDKELIDLVTALPPSERTRREFLEDLEGIVVDGEVTEGELSLLRDRYVSPSAPAIKGLKWAPSKVVNEKVYEVVVSFEAEDADTPIASARLTWIPIEYDDLPREAFPQEEARIFDLTPLDGGYGDSRESFSITISGFTGGREYEVRVEVWDAAGNVQAETLKIPYLRQYENVAKLDDVLVGAHYYPWYGVERHWGEGYKGEPLLSEYDSRNPIVICRHIDWATGHGIDFFLVSWWGPGTYEDETLKNYILKSPLIGSIKIAILYESLGRLKSSGGFLYLSEAENQEVLIADFKYLEKTYFNHPSYLRINGKPVVELYLARAFRGNVGEAISKLREEVDVYLLGDSVYWQSPQDSSELIKYFDGLTSYNMHTNVPSTLANFEELLRDKYREWRRALETEGVDFIPSAIPGFDDRAVRTGNIPLPRSIERFREQLRIALEYSWPRKAVIITSFNEWHEYTSIEPSREYGTKYLEIVLEACEYVSKRLEMRARGIVYILPSEACTSTWAEKYGDRIYFYVYANLSNYEEEIGRDFSAIREFYDTVIIVIPAEDTQLFYHNLAVVDRVARRCSLRLMWAIFPKWKYGAEEDYLEPGTAMNKLVVGLMEYLSSLDSTWKIAVWYGWKNRLNHEDIVNFYNSLPDDLKKFYAAWIDEGYAPVLDGLSGENPEFLVVTELYDPEYIIKYSGKLPWQMVITGFYGAHSPEEWLNGICGKLSLIKNPLAVGIWIFYDRGDGHGEEYGAYFPGRGLADPWQCLKV